MHVETTTANLKAAVDAVDTVVEKRPSIPILGNVLLSFDGTTLSISGTDMDVRRTRTLQASGQPGETTVSSEVLKKALLKFPKNAALTLTTEEDKIRLRAGKANLALSTMPASDYPGVRDLGEMSALPLDAGQLHDILARTKLAMSTEETRYYLNGVYLDTTGGDATFAATDGHRMTVYRSGLPTNGPKAIIPRLTVAVAHKALTKRKGTVTLRWNATRVLIELDGDVIDSKTVDGSFPDYERVIPKPADNVATAPTADVREAISRVTVVSTDKSRQVRIACGDVVDLSATSPEHGTASEQLDDATYHGEPMTVGFNSDYLASILAVVADTKTRIELTDNATPCRIFDPACPEFVGVLMPMRL